MPFHQFGPKKIILMFFLLSFVIVSLLYILTGKPGVVRWSTIHLTSLIRRIPKLLWLSTILFHSAIVAAVSGKVAFVVCRTGTISTVFGDIAGKEECLAAAALCLGSIGISGGLSGELFL